MREGGCEGEGEESYHIGGKVESYDEVDDEEDWSCRHLIICLHHHIWVAKGGI